MLMAISTYIFIYSLSIMAFTLPAEVTDSEYKMWLENCTQNEEMPYFNETVNEYECYPILEQGPCEPNYWFVLDQNKPSSAKCVEHPCACILSEDSNCQFQREINGTNIYNMVEFEGICQHVHNQGNCPVNQKILSNPFGIGNHFLTR